MHPKGFPVQKLVPLLCHTYVNLHSGRIWCFVSVWIHAVGMNTPTLQKNGLNYASPNKYLTSRYFNVHELLFVMWRSPCVAMCPDWRRNFPFPYCVDIGVARSTNNAHLAALCELNTDWPLVKWKCIKKCFSYVEVFWSICYMSKSC